MTNEEKFNQLLNSCKNPRAVHNAFLALGKSGTLDALREEKDR